MSHTAFGFLVRHHQITCVNIQEMTLSLFFKIIFGSINFKCMVYHNLILSLSSLQWISDQTFPFFKYFREFSNVGMFGCNAPRFVLPERNHSDNLLNYRATWLLGVCTFSLCSVYLATRS